MSGRADAYHECDGSPSCRARAHLHGCYAARRSVLRALASPEALYLVAVAALIVTFAVARLWFGFVVVVGLVVSYLAAVYW